METQDESQISKAKVIAAFAVIYIVWGSTYFFIQVTVQEMPVIAMGTFRFLTAGLLVLIWCGLKGEKLFLWKDILFAVLIGCLLLFIGNGAVAWSEQFLPSSIVAVFLASTPIWFALLDYSKWKENFSDSRVLIGLITGFIGIVLLFKENMREGISHGGHFGELVSIGVLIIGSISWVSGSLYAKYKSSAFSGSLNAGWQMVGAGVVYAAAGAINGDWHQVHWREISPGAWLSVLYLITMGSLLGYSAYVWLLKVRPATQVSTHGYVNPVVAVLLGVSLGGERISGLQLTGLGVILLGVLLVTLSQYRK